MTHPFPRELLIREGALDDTNRGKSGKKGRKSTVEKSVFMIEDLKMKHLCDVVECDVPKDW